jgi:hypothetical protein
MGVRIRFLQLKHEHARKFRWRNREMKPQELPGSAAQICIRQAALSWLEDSGFHRLQKRGQRRRLKERYVGIICIQKVSSSTTFSHALGCS